MSGMVGENSWRVLVKPTMQRDRHRSVWYADMLWLKKTKQVYFGFPSDSMGSEIKSGCGFLEERVEFDIHFYLNHFWDLVAAICGPCLWDIPHFPSGDSRCLMGLLMFKLHCGRWMKTKLRFQRIGSLPMDLCLTLFDIDWFSWKTHMISGQIIIFQEHGFSWNISATWIFLK